MDSLMSLIPIMENTFDSINGYDFYNYIFDNRQNYNEKNKYKPNPIYLFEDDNITNNAKRILNRNIMFGDTFEDDYRNNIECNPMALCSGLSYRGRANTIENAQHMNALVFDLDSVNENCIKNVIHRFKNFDYKTVRSIPKPTFIVLSGGGIHLYYVFEEPIELFPNIKLQMKKLKYDITFRIWNYKGTTMEKNIQYQSINQSFRMVGSYNKKNKEIIAFKTGEKVSLSYMNNYVRHKENIVDVNMRFKQSKMSREQAKEQFPTWYERVVENGVKNRAKWHMHRRLYDWWIKKVEDIKAGHRYFFLMCIAIYGVKCDIPKSEVKKDMEVAFEILKKVEHTNQLEKKDITSALESYDKGLYNFTIYDIEKLTDIRIERNKRNGRKQKQHLMGARALQEIYNPNWREGNGRPNKENLVKEYIKNNPNATPTEIARELKISRPTVYKYLN